MASGTATVDLGFGPSARTFAALARAGFRRYSTYRQAAFAAAFTNTTFGFLRCYVLLAVTGGGVAAGYDRAMMTSFVWLGQGMLGVVGLWGWTDLADRIRTGDVLADLLRPVAPVTNYLATDLGRAGFAMLARFVLPTVVGAVAFGLYAPRHLYTYPLFALSLLLAVVTCFACRYLINSAAYWLLDLRGVNILWILGSGLCCGLYFPLTFLPDWAFATIWLATPCPALFQAPLDVAVERGNPLLWIGGQLAWTAIMLLLAHVVQRRAERKLVIQGG